MGMQLSFEMKDMIGFSHVFEASFYGGQWTLFYDTEPVFIPDQKAFGKSLRKAINSEFYKEYLDNFSAITDSAEKRNLVLPLPLPVTARLLGVGDVWNDPFPDETVVAKRADDVLFDRTIIYWTNTGSQPSLYYIRRDFLKNNKRQVEDLFHKGILGKFTLSCNEGKNVYFFVPFFFDNACCLSNATWNSIAKDLDIKLSGVFPSKYTIAAYF